MSARLPESIWLLLALVLPWVFNPWGNNIFELPKVAALQTFTLLLVLANFVYTLRRGDSTRSENGSSRLSRPILWAALVMGGMVTLATLTSVSPHDSLWGSYERRQGLITQLSYLTVFLLAAMLLRTRRQATRLWEVLIWGSVPVVIYSLIQAVGLDPLNWHSDSTAPIVSTVGRSNFLGSYLAMMLPLTVGRAMLARRRWVYFSLAAGQLMCLVMTQARAAWLGVAVALWALAIILGMATHRRRTIHVIALSIVLILSAVGALDWSSSAIAQSNSPVLTKLSAMLHADSGSSAARLTIWQATLPLIGRQPWLGYGPDTMRSVFARVFPPQLVYYQGRNVDVDRAHNLWLDLGMSVGLLGSVAFGCLLIALGWRAWQRMRTTTDRWLLVMGATLLATVLGHLVDLQFSFDVTTTAAIFWLLLALTAAFGRGLDVDVPIDSIKMQPKSFNGLVYVPPALVTFALIGMLGMRPLLADVAYRAAQDLTIPPPARLEAGWRAVELWPQEREYRSGLAQTLWESGAWTEAERQLQIAGQLHPNDARTWAMRGALYAAWAQVDVRQLDKAEQAFHQAVTLAPNIGLYHALLGTVLAQGGQVESGAAELKRAVLLDATDAGAFRQLGKLYVALGQTADSAQAFAIAQQLAP